MCTIVYSLNYFNHLINLFISQCQFYSGHLPFGYVHSSRRFNFFNNIRIGNDSTAKFLFSSLGNKDLNSILLKYDITPKPPPRHLNNASLFVLYVFSVIINLHFVQVYKMQKRRGKGTANTGLITD